MSFLQGYTDLSLALAEYKANRLPSRRGLRAVADYEPHQQTFVGCSRAADMSTCLETAAAISQFEPVTFVVSDPSLYTEARQLLPDHIRVIELPGSDLVISRTKGPRYLSGLKGFAVGVDCNAGTPTGLARKLFEIDYSDCFVLKEEQRLDLSSIHVDWNEHRVAVACNLRKGDEDSSHAIDESLRGGLHEILAEAFGIESVVWCKAPCRFISANTLFSTVEKRKLFENLDDPNSNVFNVHIIPDRFMGFCLSNDGVVLPAYDDEESEEMLAVFNKKFPLRRVIQVQLKHICSLIEPTLHQPVDGKPDFEVDRNSLMRFETSISLYQKLNKLRSTAEIKKIRSTLRHTSKSRKSKKRGQSGDDQSTLSKGNNASVEGAQEPQDSGKEEEEEEGTGRSTEISRHVVAADDPLEEDGDDEEEHAKNFDVLQSPTKSLNSSKSKN